MKNLKDKRQIRRGVLLVNLGTPKEASPSHVRTYLKEFLMDPFVIDIPFIFRWMIVHLGVLPKRSVSSAEAYKKIWSEKGSPLLFHHLELAVQVQKLLEPHWVVRPVMRYGAPSIASAARELKEAGVEEVLIFPLYPQFSLAATQSSIEECKKQFLKVFPEASLQVIRSFYKDPAFIEAFASIAREHLQDYSYDHLLLSFHGLPERQVKKTNTQGPYCLQSEKCCDAIVKENSDCYKAQCYATARELARALHLKEDAYTVCFQSRLGRTPWIRPFTDDFYRQLPKRGVKKVAVMSPSFVADCLETLEEIEMRGKEEFVQNGGEDLKLIPSLNSTSVWVKAVSQMIQNPDLRSSLYK
jgi:ferrochelatase